jgi:predicted DNA-binding transcriptional regulator YafY
LVTELVAEHPADFGLSVAWERVVDQVERQRSLVSATVLIDVTLLPVLVSALSNAVPPELGAQDGRPRAVLAVPMARSIAEQLAGWGALVEVVEPESVRNELARIGSELAERYRN